MHQKVLKDRYYLLDEIRGFMVICMVVYHGFFAIDMAIGKSSAWPMQLIDFFTPIEPFFAGGFILLSGICCNFSRSNLKRGLILAVIALGFNLATYLGEAYFEFSGLVIKFGILNLLSFCMLFVGLLQKLLKKVNSYIGIIISLALFVVTFIYVAKPDFSFITVDSEYLYMFGFLPRNFYSADYFPILPWIFLYLTGFYIGKMGVIEKNTKIFSKKCIIPFRFFGKYAIIVYILHQPIIFGITILFWSILNG